MAKLNYKNGITSVVLRVKIMDSTSTTGGAKTGLAFGTAGLIVSTIADNEATATAYTQAGSTIETITTLGTFAAPTATKCRFKEVDSGNHPGLYEIQIADARWAVSSARSVIVTVSGATGAAQVDAEIQLDPVPADAAKINGVSTSGVTTVGANVGTTQPINFHGTGASAMVKVDIEEVAAVTLGTAAAGYLPADLLRIQSATFLPDAAVPIDFTQAIGSTQTDGTVGAALLGLEADTRGPETIDVIAKTWTKYRQDGLTVVDIFDLDSAGSPLVRTPR